MGIPVEFCEPWVTPDRLCCIDPVDPIDCVTGDAVPLSYPWTDEELILAASGILYRKTCRLFPGMCEITIRPCSSCHCGSHGPCGCSRYTFIALQERYPVATVDEVKIDGVVVDPDEYRLDDHYRLVRLDGSCWPSCNDLGLEDTEVGTFSVTYTAGRTPPIELQIAAAELACEMKSACGGGDCRFPSNVTSVSRQGVTMNIDALEAAVNGGTSGIPGVDLAVRQYNCARAKARVWTPGMRSTPRGIFPS